MARPTVLAPGWMINVATTIHSDEALLTVGLLLVALIINAQLIAYR